DGVDLSGGLGRGVFGDAGRSQVTDSSSAWIGYYGLTTGYEASVEYDASHDLTIVLLSNLLSACNSQLRRQIRNVVTGTPLVAIGRPLPVSTRFEAPDSLVGSFGDPGDPIIVELVDGRLIRDG